MEAVRPRRRPASGIATPVNIGMHAGSEASRARAKVFGKDRYAADFLPILGRPVSRR
jgi:hypothetical protein